MVVGEGTQNSAGGGFGTLMVTGDMKGMRQDFLRAAVMNGYGVTIHVGVGVPIPVLDTGIVRSTAVRDEDLHRYHRLRHPGGNGHRLPGSLRRPEERRSVSCGEVVRTSSLSSHRRPGRWRWISKGWIEAGRMELALPTRRIDSTKRVKPMRETAITPRVRDIMNRQVISITEDEEIRVAAKRLLKDETNHLPVLNDDGLLVGIITTFDVSKAVVTDGGSGSEIS